MTLKVENIGYERNFQNLFTHINFELKKNTCLLIRGSNGCGKTTLLRILAGLIQPLQGNIFFNDQSIFTEKNDYQNKIHYLGHQNGIKPYLTVFENLCLSASLHGMQLNCFDAILKKLNIASLKDAKAQYLSAGQLRRLALSKLLLIPRKLWILDEPTTALDVSGQVLFDELLKSHIDNDGMAIITSHHQDINHFHSTLILDKNNE